MNPKLRKVTRRVISVLLLPLALVLIAVVAVGEYAEELYWWVYAQLERVDPE